MSGSCYHRFIFPKTMMYRVTNCLIVYIVHFVLSKLEVCELFLFIHSPKFRFCFEVVSTFQSCRLSNCFGFKRTFNPIPLQLFISHFNSIFLLGSKIVVLLPCDHVSSSRLEKDPRTCKILSHQGINTIFYHTPTQN